METKKKKQFRAKKRALFTYLTDDLHNSLMKACRDSRRSITAELEVALESHLKSGGYWPPVIPTPPHKR